MPKLITNVAVLTSSEKKDRVCWRLCNFDNYRSDVIFIRFLTMILFTFEAHPSLDIIINNMQMLNPLNISFLNKLSIL